jgi:tetratricopeptide (TPR) repeat protein
MTWRWCCEKAIELDPRLGYAWVNLALALDANEKAFVNGAWISRFQCFVNAVTQDSKFGRGWLHLGKQLRQCGKTDVMIGSERYSIKKCFEEAVVYDSHCSAPWFYLGTALGDRELGHIRDNSFTKKQCLEKVIEIDPQDPNAWFHLGLALGPGEKGCNNRIDKVMAFSLALAVNPTDPDGWEALAEAMEEGGPVVAVVGSDYTKQQCKDRAQLFKDHPRTLRNIL